MPGPGTCGLSWGGDLTGAAGVGAEHSAPPPVGSPGDITRQESPKSEAKVGELRAGVARRSGRDRQAGAETDRRQLPGDVCETLDPAVPEILLPGTAHLTKSSPSFARFAFEAQLRNPALPRHERFFKQPWCLFRFYCTQ